MFQTNVISTNSSICRAIGCQKSEFYLVGENKKETCLVNANLCNFFLEVETATIYDLLGFVKGEALRLLRTNSSEITFEENILNFRAHFVGRGYPLNLIDKHLSEVHFTERKSALKQNKKNTKDILPFVTQYEPAVSNIKQVLMKKWHMIEEQPLLKEIFKDPPIISFKKGKSLKDMLVRAKI